jgi:hypothetical protein
MDIRKEVYGFSFRQEYPHKVQVLSLWFVEGYAKERGLSPEDGKRLAA